ncbi:hypothetical protein IQ07DRAFT_584820 [Pyrenochaeta sp. DS3sAY3a]|nr:hypothetical protein IQ07DRAFT_584820 [Pyrenochaeta sp. DS3sAY3a]
MRLGYFATINALLQLLRSLFTWILSYQGIFYRTSKAMLTSLPTEVFHMIVEQLSWKDLIYLSSLSHECRVQCEPFIFRNVVLYRLSKHHSRTSVRILKRLGDPDDSIKSQVRHLTVQNMKLQEDFNQDLIAALNNIRTLETFCWSNSSFVPKGILEIIYKKHPCAKLVNINDERGSNPLDETILSSPQLHTLNIGVNYVFDRNLRATGPPNRRTHSGFCEITELKIYLMRGGNLKVLRLSIIELEADNAAAEAMRKRCSESESGDTKFRFSRNRIFPASEDLALLLASSMVEDLNLRVLSLLPFEFDNTLDLVGRSSGSRLKRLSLRCCELPQIGSSTFENLLDHCRALQYLRVRGQTQMVTGKWAADEVDLSPQEKSRNITVTTPDVRPNDDDHIGVCGTGLNVGPQDRPLGF